MMQILHGQWHTLLPTSGAYPDLERAASAVAELYELRVPGPPEGLSGALDAALDQEELEAAQQLLSQPGPRSGKQA
jgi:hypothetical protein